jgi:hypothetical protein
VKWTMNKNALIVSNERMLVNEQLLLKRFDIQLSFVFHSYKCFFFLPFRLNRKSKMQNWRKREKQQRLLNHMILCLMWRKMKMYQRRRGESWKRISCNSYQVWCIYVLSILLSSWSPFFFSMASGTSSQIVLGSTSLC